MIGGGLYHHSTALDGRTLTKRDCKAPLLFKNMENKQYAIDLINELKQIERKLYLKGDDKERLEVVKKIERIRNLFGIPNEFNDGICESCT